MGLTFSLKPIASEVRLRVARIQDVYLDDNLRPAEPWSLERVPLHLSAASLLKIPGMY